MLKKFTSLFIITFMLSATAAPLLVSDAPECEHPCCSGDSCCSMNSGEEMQCDMEMTQCETHVFFSVLTAPLVKQEHQVQLTMIPVPEIVISAQSSQWIDIPQTHQSDSGPDLFRTLPLII